MRIGLERRAVVLDSPLSILLFSIGAVGVAMLLGGLLFPPFGADPVEGYSSLITNGFFELRGFGYTLNTATPLMLIAFGTIVAWRCGLIFLGFEGCLLIGAAGGTMIALQALPGGLFENAPGVVTIALSLGFGALSGALWAGVVGELKVRYGGNEVLMALMMNFLAIFLVQYLVVGPWRVPGDLPQTARIPREVWLPIIVPELRAHAGIFIALAFGVGVYVLMDKTRAGFEMVTSGLSARAARYGGIDIGMRLRQSAFIAGALAGLAGAIEILGIHHRLLDGLSEGTGFLGIVVALLGRMTVPGAVLASVLYGGLSVGGDAMQRQAGLPSSIVLIIQAAIVLLVLASELLRTHRLSIRLTRRQAAGR